MSDGFEERTGADLPSDYGYVPENGWERAPGNGWEFEPTYIHSYTKVSWSCRLQRAFRRLAFSLKRH